MVHGLTLEREGVRLAGVDFGGTGPPALLLPGLGGHSGEWAETAGWLSETHRVIALDQRGHGDSERRPDDVSLAARVDDAVFAIEQLDLAPAVVIGQSLGAITALMLAADHPALLSAIVIVDASPAADSDDFVPDVMEALAGWPDRRFDLDVMERMLRATAGRAFWEEWQRAACPALVVRAEHGIVPHAEARAMVERQPGARLVEIRGAGHDLHLDAPAQWRAALTEFL